MFFAIVLAPLVLKSDNINIRCDWDEYGIFDVAIDHFKDIEIFATVFFCDLYWNFLVADVFVKRQHALIGMAGKNLLALSFVPLQIF